MRAREFVAEALKPSQYRDLVKGWDSSRLADAFQQWPGTKNRTATRLYIDLPTTQTVQTDPQVYNKLQQLGYDVVDYTRGLARKKAGNQNPTKIGKILTAAAQAGDDTANTILQKFQNDPKRAGTRAEYQGVVSRHPYDIAGMSTDRGWTSCQDLVGGSRCTYVPQDIRAGTLVAYMITKDDVNINNPVGRILLKPYINDQNQTAYALHNESYGTVTNEFRQAVNRFATWLNNQQGIKGSFYLSRDVYYDGSYLDRRLVTVPPDATESELIDLVSGDSRGMQAILDAGITPSESVQMAAVDYDSDALEALVEAGIEPSEQVQLAAVRSRMSVGAMRILADYLGEQGVQFSPAVQQAAVERNGNSLQYIINLGLLDGDVPSEDIQLAAVTSRPEAIDWLLEAGIEPSEAVQLAAVTQNGNAIKFILNATNLNIKPSAEVRAAALANGWKGRRKFSDRDF
jgi:hypothetical protein